MPQKLHLTQLNRMSVSEFRNARKRPVEVVLDNIRSAGNVGSIFRSADAFRINKIWLCGFTPVPPDRELSKTALGAEKSVAWEYRTDAAALLSELKDSGYRCIAVEHTDASKPLNDFTPPAEPLLLILGNEVFGVQQHLIDLCDASVEIPQFGTKHSLNVSVCAGIVLWQLTQKIEPDGFSVQQLK